MSDKTIMVAYRMSEDGLTITTNYDGIAAEKYAKEWLTENGITFSYENGLYDLVFEDHQSAMLFWLKYCGDRPRNFVMTMKWKWNEM